MTTVDIIPKLGPTGDFIKIKDANTIDINNRILTLLNLLEYIEGTNSIFTDMGVYKDLYKIPYSEDVETVIEELKSKISNFLDFQVNIDYEFDYEKNITLNFTVDNLPGRISLKLRESNGFIRLFNPKYIK